MSKSEKMLRFLTPLTANAQETAQKNGKSFFMNVS